MLEYKIREYKRVIKLRHWLKELRKTKGFTQEAIAKQAFIDRTFYTLIENGRRNPSPEVANKIAAALGFNPSLFFKDISEPFAIALEASPVIVAHCDLKLRYTWIYNSHPDFNPENALGKRDDELDMNQGIIDLMDLKRTVIKTGRRMKREISFPLSTGVCIYLVYAKPLMNNHGEIIGVATSAMQIN